MPFQKGSPRCMCVKCGGNPISITESRAGPATAPAVEPEMPDLTPTVARLPPVPAAAWGISPTVLQLTDSPAEATANPVCLPIAAPTGPSASQSTLQSAVPHPVQPVVPHPVQPSQQVPSMLFNPFLGMVPQVFPQATPQFFGQPMFPSMMGVPQVSHLGMAPASGGVGNKLSSLCVKINIMSA